MAARPQCAVVIPTFNGAHLLSTCLRALLAHPPKRCDWSVVVVDDASTDDTVRRFTSFDRRVTVIARERNGGFAEACNEGARVAASADHLVFLNNDTIPLAGWLDALVDEVASHPEAAAVGSKLLYPDGTIQHAGIAIGHDRWPRHIYTGFPGDHPAVNRPKQVIAATAACLLVRRDAFEELGGFDTDFVNGFEDVDLCLRMGRQGYRVRYCPKSVLYHLESVTRWSEMSDRNHQTRANDRIYAERWEREVEPDDVEHFIADGLISIGYDANFPVRLSVSPHLATLERGAGAGERLEQLLSTRTQQLFDLRADRIRLSLDQLRDRAVSPAADGDRCVDGGGPRGLDGSRVVRRGTAHRLGTRRTRRRVSLLMPLKNAGAALRETLPTVLRQQADAEIEIVAVDSGSTDDTVAVLEEFDATVIEIAAGEFDHGLTRNLAASHASGDVLVFLNARSRPCDDRWLAPMLSALDSDPTVAGVCSRVKPYPDADPLARHDAELEPSCARERSVKRIEDWQDYTAMPAERRRLLLNFHTVSAAVRADALRRIPFRSVRTIGEDLQWAREVLEAGLALVHEPASCVFHSHEYSLRERLMRNVDDGVANRDIAERSLSESEAGEFARAMIASDWRYLSDELGLEGEELERWQIEAALHRSAQAAGQWLGVNHATLPPEAVAAFSRIADVRGAAG
jgi:GT2 family glycosyltransferase